ncbi:MAG TPA: universal stress protein [Vicinamibacterales bacterium]|jgi:nucleotide-binding universal stress UspA family protein
MAPQVTRILVPTDFSETADAALAYAKTLAAKLGASLHLMHVFQDPGAAIPFVPETYAPPPPDMRERALAEAWDQLHDRLDSEEHKRFAGTRAVVEGLAALEIVRYAEHHGIDLIVMGTHGRRGIAHLFLGSVAEHVVRTAKCPVLTVGAAATGEEAGTALRGATTIA